MRINSARLIEMNRDSDMHRKIDFISYAYGNAAHHVECEKGPAVLRKAIEKTAIAEQGHWHSVLRVNHHQQQMAALPDVEHLTTALAHLAQQAVSKKHFFVTLGGDHTGAIGSWSGAAHAIDGDLGLIWFDAHMDAHTFETTPSNNIHGMPLAILLGHGETQLTHIMSKNSKLKPENVVLIGVRSYEKGEAALLKKLGVKIFFMEDIKKIGIHAAIQGAIAIANKNTRAFGISIDLDGFDPADAPGVGTPERDGIRARDFLPEFKDIAQHPKLIGMDVMEFNPVLDQEQKTEKLVIALLEALP